MATDNYTINSRRLPPNSVTLILKNLLKAPRKSSLSPAMTRLVESYSWDTPKHFLLGLGLHAIIGQRNVMQLTNRLGNSISYDRKLDIEIAQAQRAQKLTNKKSYLPLKPARPENT